MSFAAVISLKRTIQRLKIPINPQITKSAYEELNSLRSMLERLDDRSSRSIDRSVIHELDAKIRDAAWKLEDVLESSLSLNISPSQGLDQKGVEQEIDSFFKTVKNLKLNYYRELKNPLCGEEEEDDAAVSPIHDDFGGSKSTTVGLSDLSEKIINELVDGTSELKMVSLVGMAGIGKTHLATQIFHHPLILQHFDSWLWVRVGPKDQINNIFVDIVAQIESKPRDLFKGKNILTLKVLLRKSLRGRRYLIVLDDILWQNVFVAEKSFPSLLEKAGRKIAEECEGLPLLILAVANILRGLDKTEEYWKKVAEKKTTTFTDAYDQIYKLLLSSYEYLPQHLKPCFLYMGVFPQSCEIPLSKLINLWDVEDFIEQNDLAINCVEDLVFKTLAIVCKRNFERVRIIKSLKLHSAYWYLCVAEARNNKFLHVLKKLTDVSKDYIESHRRLSFQNNILLGLKDTCMTQWLQSHQQHVLSYVLI